MALTLTDITSNNNDLTNSGAVESSSVPFNGENNSHSLDLESGSNQYASIADASQTGLDITGDMTLECWVKFETVTECFFINKWGQNPNKSYVFNFTSAPALSFTITSNGSTNTTKAVTWSPTAGIWYHVAVSYDASAGECRFYVNGIQQGATQTGLATSIYDNAHPFTIGVNYNGGTLNNLLDGLIDDARVWNDLRTAQEIADNFAKELVGNEANLVGNWKFNNSALDETSNNNDLTLSGSPSYSTDVGFSGTNATSADLELSDPDYLYITDANQTGLDITGDLSFECWLKIEQLPSTAGTKFGIFNKWSASAGNFSYLVQVPNTSDKVQVFYSGDGTNFTIAATSSAYLVSADVGKWIHFTVTIDVSEKSILVYKNGVSVSMAAASGTQTSIYNGTANFQIGSLNSADYFDGLIDDVRVWNDIRTPTEVGNNFTRPLVGNEAGLVAYWNWETTTTTSIKDLIGGGIIAFPR